MVLMSTIYATRLGFCYQDKMACLLFLKELRAGTIRELYTDYPMPENQHSLDILLKIGTSDTSKERVYEVKTGEYFKNDSKSTTKKGQSSEIRDVVLTFLEYSKLSPDFEGFISFSNGLKIGINSYIGPANTLRLNARLTSPTRAAADDLKTKLGIPALNTQREIHNFFKRVTFDELPYDNNHTWTTLDEHIRSEITEIANALGINDHVHELPNEYLAAKLLYTIQKLTGSGNDVTKELLAEVMDFMSLRKLLDNHSVPGVPSELKREAKQYVKNEMISKFKVETLLPDDNTTTSDIAATDTGVGGVIDE
jgi:hypothetical protein